MESLFPGNTEALVVAGLMTLTPNVVVILGQVRLDLLNGVTAWEEGQSRAWILFRALVLGNPILLSTVAGLALAVSGSGLWAPLDRACALVGFTAAPCMLVSLGFDLGQKLRLALTRSVGHAIWRQVWLVSCKLVLCPLLCWLIMAPLGVEPLWLGVGVLMSATGSALVASVLAQVYNALPEEAAFTAVLSNGVSLVTLTACIMLLQFGGYF